MVKDRTRVDFRVAIVVRVVLQIRATQVVFRDLLKATGPLLVLLPWVVAEHPDDQASQYPFQNPVIITLNGTIVLTGTQVTRGHAIS